LVGALPLGSFAVLQAEAAFQMANPLIDNAVRRDSRRWRNYGAPLLAALSFLLASCGGGGDDDGSGTPPATNRAPTAVINVTPASGHAPLDVSLSGSASSDTDGTIVSYRFTAGGATLGSTSQVRHTFTEPGEYQVTLTVTDDDGATATASAAITVMEEVSSDDPSPFGSAPVKVVCEPGSGKDYLVGPGQPYETIGAVPWENLAPGDTVRIHHKATAYHEKIFIINSGTDEKPIRVCGVPGPNGELPVISGENATTRVQLLPRIDDFEDCPKSNPDCDPLPDYSVQRFGVVAVRGTEFGQAITNIIIEGLSITGTLAGAPVSNDENPTNSFIATDGVSRKWDTSAACVWVQRASAVIVRGNELSWCGSGMFTLSKPETAADVIRFLLVEGNYFHDNNLIDDYNRHQAYLQGVDFTIQYNYFGDPRSIGDSSFSAGSALKTRVAGLTVRYNYFRNGARLLDLVEIEDFASHVMPWKYAERRATELADLSPEELEESDAIQALDWAKYHVTFVYGNLLHVSGRGGATNPVHYGFDNSQHDREPGTLWFYNNTYLAETDHSDPDVVRLFDYGSDFGDAGYYGYPLTLLNAVPGSDGKPTELHYITDENGDTCLQLSAGCTDWGAMSQHRQDEYGRFRAFNNAIVLLPYTSGAKQSAFELTRNLWDQVELGGGNWISDTWNIPDPDTGNTTTPGFGIRVLEDAWPGGNDKHHVTGVPLLEGPGSPIVRATFQPLSNSQLLNKAVALPEELPRPDFQIMRDPSKPGALVISPRDTVKTIGAIESASDTTDPGPRS
jgi:PKD repeat protein